MSNHFTYEIDERNVRLQLKGYKFDAKETDWQRFQLYSAESVGFRKGIKVADKVNITLNRNVILPLVFGVIILAFSLLLVNFMSIKTNPHSLNVSTSLPEKTPSNSLKAIMPSEKTEALAKKQIPTEAKAISTPIAEKGNIPVNDQKITEISNQTPLNEGSDKEPELAKTQSIIKSSAAPSANVAEGKDTATSEPSKKKRKKSMVETIQSELSPELRPTGVTEDQEAEVRPE